MDIDFLQIDLNPCIIGQGNEAPNYFAGTAKCKPTTMVGLWSDMDVIAADIVTTKLGVAHTPLLSILTSYRIAGNTHDWITSIKS